MKQSRKTRKPSSKQNGIDLSVIVPAYNLEKCIGECLDSILRQKITQMEVIVVDDCSKDKTWDIIQRYAGKYRQIVPISFQENRGVSAARNAALDVAKGTFIHFCDGDDLVPDGAYEELLSVAEEEDADLVTGNYSRKYPNEGNAIRPFSHYSAPTGKERCFESGNTMLWNKLYRRFIIEENKIRFYEELKYYEDFLFYHQFVLKCSKVAFTDMSVYVYTEPLFRAVEGKIRYANLDSVLGLDKAWRTLFSSPIEEDEKLWQLAYRWNLDWYFQYCWRMIQDPQTRLRAFEIMRELVCWVQRTIKFCDWFKNGRMQEFVNIFRVDYSTFCMIGYEDYLFHLATADNIQPRMPNVLVNEELGELANYARDKKLSEDITKQLEEIRAIFQSSHENKYVWKVHYWNLLDSVMNDYWRQLIGIEVKAAFYEEIRAIVERMRVENPLCGLPTSDDLWRFKQIFCMDNAQLQALTFSQYVMACAPRGGDAYAGDPIAAFVHACEGGRVGMRGILKACKAWVVYKFSRRKR